MRKLVSKKELVIIAAILLAAVFAYFLTGYLQQVQPLPQGETYARISMSGYPSIYVNLSENKAFNLPQHPDIWFEIFDNSIRFMASDCPDQVCIRMGELFRMGQSAACLPNFVTVVIVPSADEYDMIV